VELTHCQCEVDITLVDRIHALLNPRSFTVRPANSVYRSFCQTAPMQVSCCHCVHSRLSVWTGWVDWLAELTVQHIPHSYSITLIYVHLKMEWLCYGPLCLSVHLSSFGISWVSYGPDWPTLSTCSPGIDQTTLGIALGSKDQKSRSQLVDVYIRFPELLCTQNSQTSHTYSPSVWAVLALGSKGRGHHWTSQM